jgi:hypothetical protein
MQKNLRRNSTFLQNYPSHKTLPNNQWLQRPQGPYAPFSRVPTVLRAYVTFHNMLHFYSKCYYTPPKPQTRGPPPIGICDYLARKSILFSSGNWTWKIFKEYEQAGWCEYSPAEGIRLSNYCLCTFTAYIRAVVPAPNILVADVFGTGIFH